MNPDSEISTLAKAIQHSHEINPQEQGRSIFKRILQRRSESFKDDFPFAWTLVLCSLGLNPYYDGTDHNIPHFYTYYPDDIYPKKVLVEFGHPYYPCDSAFHYLNKRHKILKDMPWCDNERVEMSAALSLIHYMDMHYKPWLNKHASESIDLFAISTDDNNRTKRYEFAKSAQKYPFEFLRTFIYFAIQKLEGEHAQSNEQSVLIRQAMLTIDSTYAGNSQEATNLLIREIKNPTSALHQALHHHQLTDIYDDIIHKANFINLIGSSLQNMAHNQAHFASPSQRFIR